MNQFKPINDQDIQYFKTIIGEQFVSGDPEVLKNYSKDETPDETLRLLPEVVIKPTTNKEIQLITRYCFEKNIAITPRGAGSGLSGGSIPAYGGVVLSFFFQAEDGIRDLVRSRGLGDVYKRQSLQMRTDCL